MRFGIVCALAAEAGSFAAPRGRWLGEHDYVVATSGAGGARAAAVARALTDDGAEVLVSWGLAGGLDPGWRAGDLQVAGEVRDAERHAATDARLAMTILEQLGDGVTVRRGALLTVTAPVTLGSAKRALHERSGAHAVDMESSAIADVASTMNLPFLAIRCIVDPAGFDVPAIALAGVDDDGRPRPWRTAAAAIVHPGQVPGLLALFGHYRAAMRTLTATATKLTR
ncbi:MAG: 5'-methylthioadenosine nucleosidase [Gammaproteobacteria bacterium]